MATTISAKCRTLADAAIKRWPAVYGPEIREKLAEKLAKITGEGEQILATRLFLLDWAANQCGKCQSCSLHNNRCCGAVWGDGSPMARVFVIGEGPGQYEQRSTIPFTYAPELSKSYCQIVCENFGACFPPEAMKNGFRLPDCLRQRHPVSREEMTARAKRGIPHIVTAAEHLNKAIDGLFTRDCWNNGKPLLGEEKVVSDLYIANLVRCRSLDKQGDDTPPPMEAIKSCWNWLELQLALIQPQVVIILGKPAGAFMFGLAADAYKVGEFNGKFGPRPQGGFTKLPGSVKFVGTAYHPSYVKRSYDENVSKGDSAFAGIRSVFEQAFHAINGG